MDYSPIKDNNLDIENLIKSLDKDVEMPPHKGNQVNTMNWFVKFPILKFIRQYIIIL